MARLIEVQDPRRCPSTLTVQAKDVLMFHAAGGHIQEGGDVIELLGTFLSAVLGDDGNILTPLGPPNVVLISARRPGRALISVITGDPFHKSQTVTLSIIVES